MIFFIINLNIKVLIVDGFREGEMSTPTEKKVLDEFKKISKQVILTATLKDEEYHKYDSDKFTIIKHDFSNVISKHLLQKSYVDELVEKIKIFNLKA